MKRAKEADETAVAVAPGGPPVSAEASLAALERRLEERMDEKLAEQWWMVIQAISGLEVRVVDGYFVKIWQNPETQVWIADCPTVGAVVQDGSEDEVASAIVESIEDMIEVLLEAGHAPPPKDV
jgi:hypothetical protein